MGESAQMLLQRSQTSSGMIPKRISTAKILQPRQNANTDSRAAATMIERDEHVRHRRLAEPEVGDDRRDRERCADPLREALRRTGDELGLDVQRRCDDARRELTQRAQRRAGQDPGDEAVREHHEEPRLVERDGQHRDDHDAAGHQAR